MARLAALSLPHITIGLDGSRVCALQRATAMAPGPIPYAGRVHRLFKRFRSPRNLTGYGRPRGMGGRRLHWIHSRRLRTSEVAGRQNAERSRTVAPSRVRPTNELAQSQGRGRAS